MTREKIELHHLERKAILYVRQSSAHQVLHNREKPCSSTRHARDRLTALGWSCIETVDDDLGSAAGGVTRAGFERMVADVCLGKVGRLRHERYRALNRPPPLSPPQSASRQTVP
jgi:DNA invertase Pin-like site-specific DNA recombinase